jgi:hypothetical protein
MPGLSPAEQIKELAALLQQGLLTAAEFGALKRQAIATAIAGGVGAARSTPANRVKMEPPAPAAAADCGARGGGQRVAAQAVPEPTCVRSAKRRAVGAGVSAAAPELRVLDPALKVRRGSHCQFGQLRLTLYWLVASLLENPYE